MCVQVSGRITGDDHLQLLFMDETTLSLHPPLRACWIKQGEKKRISTPGQQRSHHLFAVYNWRRDTVTWQAAERKNSEHFIAFLEHRLVHTDPTGLFVLVLGNAPYHKNAASLAALSLFEHSVWVFWLPPYCSMLNLIERFWRFLKDRVCVNRLFPNMADLLASVQTCLPKMTWATRIAFLIQIQRSCCYLLKFVGSSTIDYENRPALCATCTIDTRHMH